MSTCHDWLFRVEDGVVRHGPLLCEGEAAQLGRLLEGLLELERHVLRAEIELAFWTQVQGCWKWMCIEQLSLPVHIPLQRLPSAFFW